MTLTASKSSTETHTELASPDVGVWHPAVTEGDIVRPGNIIGSLVSLGRARDVLCPAAAGGRVERLAEATPVSYGAVLLSLAAIDGATLVTTDSTVNENTAGDLVFRSPSSGRFYCRANPDSAPFIEVGTLLESGAPVFLLEVMKTFSRITYSDDGLPQRARVTAVLANDGDDVEAGQPVVALEHA